MSSFLPSSFPEFAHLVIHQLLQVGMVAIVNIAPTFLLLGLLLLELGVSAHPVNAPAVPERMTTESPQQSRWHAVVERVCKNGKHGFCQAHLPHNTPPKIVSRTCGSP
jgi:hypothetical protein